MCGWMKRQALDGGCLGLHNWIDMSLGRVSPVQC